MGVVWCGVMWCGIERDVYLVSLLSRGVVLVWCGAVRCGVVWYGMGGNVVWCGVVWY